MLWGLVALRDDMPDWRFLLFTALCGLGLINALWDLRPPRREEAAPPAAVARESTPTG